MVTDNDTHIDTEQSPQKRCCPCRKRKRGATPIIKLNSYDYFSHLPKGANEYEFTEVQFKNTRKGYYTNPLGLELHQGDMVAVESSPGHDIGMVTLTGKLVALQMKKIRYRHPGGEIRQIYRLAKESDMEKYHQTKALEHSTMIRSREIAKDLGLDMKIGDVEYQADGLKAIFYYISDDRVDFRTLIKKLAEEFHIRIEMKQIGARQEAGRIGGIGPCGRELCCSQWMPSFLSVGTNAARIQDLSMNPLKLAGQCGKLKCCINFETDVYAEAQKKMPSREVRLRTQLGMYKYFKADILAKNITYAIDNRNERQEGPAYVTISADRAFRVIRMNKEGEIPFSPEHDAKKGKEEKPSKDILNESISRFDAGESGTGEKKRRSRSKSSSRRRKEAKADRVAD